MREGRTAGGSNEHHCTGAEAERSAISDDRSTICENFISFFHFSEIKRESKRKKERNTLREGRREHQSRGRAICDEGRAMTTTTSELRRCDHGLLGLVCWGLVLVCVLGIFFFFFFYKHLCVWFAGVCFAFALYRQYWGLISLPAT